MHKALSVLTIAAILAAMLLVFVPSGTVSAQSAPVLSGVTITDIAPGTMKVNYTLDDGGEACQVYIVWAQNGDDFTGIVHSSYIYGNMRNSPEPGVVDTWPYVVDEGVKSSGSYSEVITGVPAAPAIAQTVYAFNSAGADKEYVTPYPSTQTALAGPVLEFASESSGGSVPFLDDVWRAQTFTTVGAIDVTQVFIQTKTYNTDVTATVEIWGVDGSNEPDDSNKLGSATTTVFDGWNTGVVFAAPVALSATTMYAIVVHSDDHSTWREWWYVSGNEYADGAAWRSNTYDGSTWYQPTGEEGYDFRFKLYDCGAFSGVDYPGGYTGAATSVAETTASLTAEITYIGGANNTTFDQEDLTVYFEYGTTMAYGSSTVSDVISPTVPYTYSKAISGLTAGTVYHYRLRATNNAGELIFADRSFSTRDISEEGSTVGTSTMMSLPHQRNSFYAEGRHWLFYVTPTSEVVYVSSTDGDSWSSTTEVADNLGEYSFALTFDGQYVHVIWARRAEPLYYRMGEPQSGGTITWLAAAQEALARNGAVVDDSLWTTPSITHDVDGNPWIISGICENPNSGKVVVTTSTTRDGTWTVKSGFPTAAGDIFGAYYQRGSLVGLDNGDMYAVAGKRSDGDFWSCNKWVGDGGEYLKGSLWDSGTETWGVVETITDTRMAFIGDGAMDPYLLWSVTSYVNDVYLVFTNQVMTTAPDSTHNIQVVQREYGVGWGSEVTVQADVLERTAPVVSIDHTGHLYCFWGNSPDQYKLYYKKREDTTWDTNPTVWKYENTLQGSGVGGAGLFNIQSWETATEGLAAVYYNNGDSIKIAYMETGFAVSTSATADITGSSATFQGYIVHDGGETCEARFQYGTTIAYGSTTAWQSGFTTSDLFSQAIAGLEASTVYYVRAQAKHSDGTTVNGASRTFTTDNVGVTTGAATDVDGDSATLHGILTLGVASADVYFEYWGYGGVVHTTTAETMTSGGGFDADLIDLEYSKTYFYRACADYDGVTAYGTTESFTTTGHQLPTDFGDTVVEYAFPLLAAGGVMLAGLVRSRGNPFIMFAAVGIAIVAFIIIKAFVGALL